MSCEQPMFIHGVCRNCFTRHEEPKQVQAPDEVFVRYGQNDTIAASAKPFEGAARFVSIELVARAIHEACWRQTTTEPPEWDRCAERIRNSYRRDATWYLDRYVKAGGQ